MAVPLKQSQSRKLRFVLRGGLGNQLAGVATGLWLSGQLRRPVRFDLTGINSSRIDSVSFLDLEFEGTPQRDRSTPARVIHILLRKVRLLAGWDLRPTFLKFRSLFLGQEFLGLGHVPASRYNPPDTRGTAKFDGFFSGCTHLDDAFLFWLRESMWSANLSSWARLQLNLIEASVSIGVHFRGGDMKASGIPMASAKFYRTALMLAEQELGCHPDSLVRYVLTDDALEARDFFSRHFPDSNFLFVAEPKETPAFNSLLLLSSCDAIVAANSTFSFWAAHLKKKLAKAYGPVVDGPNGAFGSPCEHRIARISA